MKCPHCGGEVHAQDDFCYQCGAKLPATKPVQTPPVAPDHPPPISTLPVPEITMNAGFWRRFAAWLLDAIILAIPLGLTSLFIGYFWWGWWSGWLVNIIIEWAYFGYFESSEYQATPGKMVLGIIVTDLAAEQITFGRATARHFSKIISALTLGIGFLLIGFTERKQGLHDMIANTLVIVK